jgi:hypothetical protein
MCKLGCIGGAGMSTATCVCITPDGSRLSCRRRRGPIAISHVLIVLGNVLKRLVGVTFADVIALAEVITLAEVTVA